MPTSVLIEVREGNLREGINSFLRSILEKKMLDALLVPLELPSGGMTAPALVSDPAMLGNANPLAPVMMVSTARLVSSLTKVAASQRKVGVVMRPCELRALIELIKLKQASRENLVFIGVDCYGTCRVNDYNRLCQETSAPAEELLKRVKRGDESLLRDACRVCEYPAPINADIVIGLIGTDTEKGFLVRADNAEGESILEGLGLKPGVAAQEKEREQAIAELVATHVKNKNELYTRFEVEATGVDSLLSALSSCTNCHNCRVACPLCYCRECFFDSPTFEWEAEKYLGWADKRGAIRMPTDSLLFHLTRLNHMVASCVGCGLCQEACPNDVPVFPIFRKAGEQVQKTFDYLPGRSLEDELPLSVFREEELGEVGES
ncbi:MAG: Coenzyme F420 hydrogenase/dehydrogenase, beta subunit C-terminal domain [Chloroflexota bacterium]